MAWTRTYDGAEPVRINKWLGQTGVCSRREADALIADGLVSIDGEVVRDAGRKLEPGQTLTLNDRATAALAQGQTILLHKPVGYVSGQPEPGKIPAARLLNMAVQPVVCEMLPRGQGWRVRFLTPLEGFPTADAEADTARLNHYIEGLITQMPAQYLWVHKRFKTRPPGAPPVY